VLCDVRASHPNGYDDEKAGTERHRFQCSAEYNVDLEAFFNVIG
jgi:hypothetical protein